MNNSSERTAPSWLTISALFSGSKSRSASEREGSLSAAYDQQSRVYRMHLIVAVSLSLGLHLVLLFGFNHKAPKVAAAKLEPKIAVESFKIPVEEPEPSIEDTAEVTSTPMVADFAPPMQAELLSIPVETDFVIAPMPPAPENLGPQPSQFIIPASAGRAVGGHATQKIFTLSELDRAPQLTRKVNPVYPMELIRSKIAGLVVVQFIVDPEGEVQHLKIISSPHPLLGAEVARAVSRWHFRPGVKGGKAVNTTMELPVEFSPEDV